MEEHEDHEGCTAINCAATMLYIERQAALSTLFSALMLPDVHSIELYVGCFV